MIVPTLLLWGCDLEAHPYRVRFITPPSDVRFDGKAAKLDASNNLTFPRWTFGTHTVEYRDASGAEKKIVVHPRLDDNRMIPLNVREDSVEGVPTAEFVAP